MPDKSILRLLGIAGSVLLLDQLTKRIILLSMFYGESHVVVPGFFKLVYLGNTGAAWSLFYGNNHILAVVSVGACLFLFLARRHFEVQRLMGQVSLGLILGGIAGNLIDRIRLGHVVDFLYFFIERRGGSELGFPAFNVADMAICSGVGLVLLIARSHAQTASGAARQRGP